jgi:hypothetical protein
MILLPSAGIASQVASQPHSTAEFSSKYSLGAMAINPGQNIHILGLALSHTQAQYSWNKNSRRESFQELSLGGIAAATLSETTSFFMTTGLQHLQANSKLILAEGSFFGRYKPKDVTWKLDVVWEGYTHSFPLFLFAGAEWKPSQNWRAEILLPARCFVEYNFPKANTAYQPTPGATGHSDNTTTTYSVDAFFESARNSTLLLRNNNLFPGQSETLEFKREQWKAGLGSNISAFRGNLRFEGGTLVLQKNRVKDKAKLLHEEKLPSSLYVKASLQFPSMKR